MTADLGVGLVRWLVRAFALALGALVATSMVSSCGGKAGPESSVETHFLDYCTNVCPEGIKITDNAIIPLKERVVDELYDPVVRLLSWARGERG